jgi:anti-sigma factor RsiW
MGMADCKKYREIISAFADGELSGNEKNEFEKHLETCTSCRSLLLLYTGISEAAAGSLPEPPDSFTENVMSKIKSLPENSVTHPNAERKRQRSMRPVIISFVAAAACLALAFIVSPGLFSLTGTWKSTASVPMASAAPDSSLQAASAEENFQYDIRSDESSTAGDAAAVAKDVGAGSPASTDGFESDPGLEMGITAATEAPLPEGSSAPQIETTGKSGEDELKVYYAVFVIEGQLPDVITDPAMTDNRDGTFNIVISAETAEQMIADGLVARRGAPESAIALVIYTPPS